MLRTTVDQKRIDFTVSIPGKTAFEYAIFPETSRIEASVTLEEGALPPPVICPQCAQIEKNGICHVYNAISPILWHFADVISHADAVLEYRHENVLAVYRTSAQRAVFILSIYGMFHSKCKFFGRFGYLLNLYKVNISDDIFMHMVLTDVLLRQYAATRAVDFDSVIEEVHRFGEEVRQRLYNVYENVRKLQKKDAAINAFQILFNLNFLSMSFSRQYLEGLAQKMLVTSCLGEKTPQG